MSPNKSIVEGVALTWSEGLGCAIGHGPHMAHSELLMKAAEPHLEEATL